ncbi:MAG: hypothetical protein ACTSX9_07040 [Candidatus Njordarchaeales archaeon]
MRKIDYLKELRSNIKLYVILIPIIFRLLSEVYAGIFPIGYDTSMYYIVVSQAFLDGKKSFIDLWRIAPLYYFLLIPLCYFLSRFLAVKVLAIILSGLFGLSLFYWIKSLGFNE